jgi:hypothetical protein
VSNIITEIRFFYTNTAGTTNYNGFYADYSYFQRGIPSTPPASAYTAGIDVIINGQVINADTTTGLTKLATQGDITRAILASIPNLQAVTDIGSTTTNIITAGGYINNTAVGYADFYGVGVAVNKGAGVVTNAQLNADIPGNSGSLFLHDTSSVNSR